MNSLLSQWIDMEIGELVGTTNLLPDGISGEGNGIFRCQRCSVWRDCSMEFFGTGVCVVCDPVMEGV